MHAIQITNLTLYLGETEALQNINCCIHEGQFLAILGPNGAGKSTLLKVILGLFKPTRGTVRIFERAPEDIPPGWIGYVPQIKTFDRSFPAIVLELVVTGLRNAWVRKITASEKEKAQQALELIGAGHLAERTIGSLSGGELQRTYLARSLVRNPRIILLDEPATGIDLLGESDLYNVLKKYRQDTGATIIMVTHDLEMASQHAGDAMILNKRLVSYGPTGETLCEDCLQKAYLEGSSRTISGIGGATNV
jgi:zinc transport system ATP-binding protein